MPSTSQAQQELFGYLYSHPGEAKERGINMTREQIRDFAATPRSNLPEYAPKKKFRYKAAGEAK